MAIALSNIPIAISTTTSETFNLTRATSGSFSIPAAITGTTIQPRFSNDGTNWTSVGSAISVSANGTYTLPDDLFKANFAQLVSNASEAATRVIIVALRS